MCLLILAFITSGIAASIDFIDVSDRFDDSLERMLKNLKGSDHEMASIGKFPGGNTWIINASMGNFTTIRRESQVSLFKMNGRLSVEGGLSLGEMLIVGMKKRKTDEIQHKIIVRENLWNYNFWINQESEDCNEGLVVLLTDIGEMKLIFDNGHLVVEQDVTHWIKQHMNEPIWHTLSGAVTEVFRKHFDFCNLLLN